jgi:hypothetical protein
MPSEQIRVDAEVLCRIGYVSPPRVPMQQALQFVHRPNPNRSFDSICRACYQTVGNRSIEGELDQDEKNHVCELGHPYSGAFNIEDHLGVDVSK